MTMISESDCNCILHRYVWRPAFKMLCMVAIGRKDLTHWNNASGDEWEKHVKVIIRRFNYSNINAGLILTTSAILLSSQPPLTSLLAYDTPAAYTFTVVAFGAALLSVISGCIALITYESCTAHKDMDGLKYTPPWQRICLLVWMAGPSIYMVVSTISLLLSVLIACFSSENYAVKVIAALSVFVFLSGGIVTLGVEVLMEHLKWSTSAGRNGRSAIIMGVSSHLANEGAGLDPLLPFTRKQGTRLGDVQVLSTIIT